MWNIQEIKTSNDTDHDVQGCTPESEIRLHVGGFRLNHTDLYRQKDRLYTINVPGLPLYQLDRLGKSKIRPNLWTEMEIGKVSG